ncbi:acyl-CoA dehydrogenase [Legionella oakridgensis]|uniref:Acyl-coenzyme A dehydrogenase n=2 Tax=Legionella oakridgensis TaxID=29423 RepID=W0B9T0_9GAMM|nr:acyl-CoA dehydrogenase [Legionella oakridgensis]AHE67273.1 acyl-CoA dehydrogenase [Legionella oakridgensis ATCC 33761 = DSM 21215]ETO93103.1 acyl-CoA dehydrogenase [Legionella oakridgensis RV-2-2007]KTD37938.1 acyl-CoA dehydrogenase [Legionella oakridgensis]STY20341.1 oxidoreductase, acyl CoA dehydrogenase family [Legionella longbeachae]
MLHSLLIVMVLSVVCLLLVKQASLKVWFISYAIFALLVMKYGSPGLFAQTGLWLGFALFLIGTIRPLRQGLLTRPLLHIARQAMPAMSATEREALEAGSIGWEGELFSGAPDFSRLHAVPAVRLSEDEQAFLNGPVNTLCRMIDDWDITHNRADMPPEMWTFIKSHGFLGMIIPKRYGGLGFSATGQMSVLVKLYSRSVTVASTISVPNSLGPAELLLKYGTEEQKNYYLPRLANGTDIPCFALTGPNAGSDAASIPDQGIVCREQINGQEVLGIRLNWDKRYITLCPVATVIGLAFRLFDPDNLLGKGHDVGISCALIPADTPGVIKGRRHFPLNIAFLNGPTQGKNVFIPLDYLIGGEKMAGQGWRMLMECLSAGRAISLPSSAAGGTQAISLGSGAYARVRKQFNQPIGKFEGIEEVLARIAGKTYMINAALAMTTTVIDAGVKSAVAGAILKYHTTEWARSVALDAMDIHGGKGICLGPNNYLGRGYQGAPISITVEGANILTRSLIIFGQGAIRCHPYVFLEMESIKNNDLSAFDQALWGHAAFILANFTRSLLFSFTDGRVSHAPAVKMKRYYQWINRYSSHLAFLADFSMMTLGATLKRKETLSARLGDMLSYLYVASAVLNRFQQDGEPDADLPLVEWCCQYLLHECESAMRGVIANFPRRWGRAVLRIMLQPLGSRRTKPSDKLGQTVARLLIEPNETRSRLTSLVFAEPGMNCPLGQLEAAFHKLCAVEALEKKVAQGVREKVIHALTLLEQIEEAKAKGILNAEEAQQLKEAEQARQQVIAVDDFNTEELVRQSGGSKAGKKHSNEEVVPLAVE